MDGILYPFKTWYRLLLKNAPFGPFNKKDGIESFKDRLYYWVITLSLPFILVVALAYVLEGIKYILNSM